MKHVRHITVPCTAQAGDKATAPILPILGLVLGKDLLNKRQAA